MTHAVSYSLAIINFFAILNRDLGRISESIIRRFHAHKADANQNTKTSE